MFWHNFLPYFSEMRLATFRLLAITIVTAICVYAEQTPATVSFTLDFPGANPSHYEIAVTSEGQGSYSSDGKIDDHSDPVDAGKMNFTVSEKVRTQIFELAKSAHYFNGKVDSGRKNVANTGAKTLAYKDASRSSQATYNYSSQVPIERLTSIFQGLSTTLESGRRLSYFHKYEKLALDDELKRMEELQKEDSLVDIPAIEPVLKNIASDSSIMNVSRARALRLLNTGEAASK